MSQQNATAEQQQTVETENTNEVATATVEVSSAPEFPSLEVIQECVICMISEEDYLLNNHQVPSGFLTCYVKAVDGEIYKHSSTQGGGYVLTKADKIKTALPKTELKEMVNFLPGGKIPYEILDQIVAFFKKVMHLNEFNKTATGVATTQANFKHEYEAMAHVLWNAEQGYHVSIPKQTVSKANVSYTFDHIDFERDTIVLDIHSHNTMGAFFSGTDNTDDKRGVWYSGVVGKLDKRNPEFAWRFNFEEVKAKTTIDDIFESRPEDVVDVPAEWIEQVSVQKFGGYNGYAGGYNGYRGGSSLGKQKPHQSGNVVKPRIKLSSEKDVNRSNVGFTESNRQITLPNSPVQPVKATVLPGSDETMFVDKHQRPCTFDHAKNRWVLESKKDQA